MGELEGQDGLTRAVVSGSRLGVGGEVARAITSGEIVMLGRLFSWRMRGKSLANSFRFLPEKVVATAAQAWTFEAASMNSVGCVADGCVCVVSAGVEGRLGCAAAA